MLHSIKPDDFVSIEYLNKQWECCECKAPFVFGNGYIFLSHYIETSTQEKKYGLMCFCSKECGLAFESPQYLGRA